MIRHFGTSLRVTIVTVLLFGLVYPLAMTAVAQILFPRQANGSLVTVAGKAVGSAIIGQLWTKPRVLSGASVGGRERLRPDVNGRNELRPDFQEAHRCDESDDRIAREGESRRRRSPPIDLVTSSASGIDPDISPAAAYWEAPRVARARGIEYRCGSSVDRDHVQGRTFGLLGEPHVNVLDLNLALDGLKPQ